jgi:hypothetical protein
MSSIDNIKTLQILSKKIQEEVSIIDKEINRLKEERQIKVNRINQIQTEIKNLLPKDVQITEHALLRYCQRILGIDVEQIKSKLLSKNVKQIISVLGNGEFPVDDKTTIVVKNNAIVTVINRD